MPNLVYNPFPLGKVVVATPGTLVPLCQNFSSLRGNATYTLNLRAAKLFVQTDNVGVSGGLAPNAGRIYIGYAGMVRATLVNVLFWVDPGSGFWYPQYGETNSIPVCDLFMDADNANDWALVHAMVAP